jgi:hypothetical protein
MSNNTEDGVSAITAIIAALKPLDDSTRRNVLDFVLRQLGIKVGTVAPAVSQPIDYEAAFPTEVPQANTAEMDIRTLAEQKQPKTANDRVAVLAYYLRNLAPPNERREFIKAEDIMRYFPSAGFELPTAPRMALTNAKNAGYFHSIGNGQFRLNPVGHNLVAHKLPLDENSVRKRAKRSKPKKRR